MVSLQTAWSGALNEYRYRESELARTKLFDPDGNEVAPTATEGLRLHYRRDGLKPGVHRAVSVDGNYLTAGIRGRATVTSTFDTRREDLSDPDISALRVMNGKGESQSTIGTSDAVHVAFLVADYEEPPGRDVRYDPVRTDATKLSLKAHGSATWTSVPLRIAGGATATATAAFKEALPGGIEFRADIERLLPGYYDLKIESEDRNGNRTELMLEPAFAVSSDRRRAAGR
jgi:hypothetical protein